MTIESNDRKALRELRAAVNAFGKASFLGLDEHDDSFGDELNRCEEQATAALARIGLGSYAIRRTI